MSKVKKNRPKTAACASCCGELLRLLIVLAFVAGSFQAAYGQQSAPIQPCTESPSTKKTAAAKIANVPARTAKGTETLVDGSIPDDPALKEMLKPYTARVRALEDVIGRLEGDLIKGGVGAGSLGNFVTDGLRAQVSKKLAQPVTVMITNSGGLRKNAIAEGELRVKDIFELLPFENALIRIDLTGEQLLKLLGLVLTGRDAQSGARITYRLDAEKRPEFVSAKIVTADGRELEIDRRATYTIGTNDYLYKLGSGDYAILQEGKNVQPIGITMRDAMLDYVKSETAAGRPIKPTLDGRFVEKKPEGQ
ncbi:MAG: 5'-nucleotidase C-terminal domain-containing protein [Pyrinomonadaceae bacterium]